MSIVIYYYSEECENVGRWIQGGRVYNKGNLKGEGTHRGNLCENSSLLQTKIKGPLLSPRRLLNMQVFILLSLSKLIKILKVRCQWFFEANNVMVTWKDCDGAHLFYIVSLFQWNSGVNFSAFYFHMCVVKFKKHSVFCWTTGSPLHLSYFYFT